jgi:hypothetical protein
MKILLRITFAKKNVNTIMRRAQTILRSICQLKNSLSQLEKSLFAPSDAQLGTVAATAACILRIYMYIERKK